MSDLSALADRAAYLARVATVADESVAGLDTQLERLTAELAVTKDARTAAVAEAKAAHQAATDAVAEHDAAVAALADVATQESDVRAAAGVAKGSAR